MGNIVSGTCEHCGEHDVYFLGVGFLNKQAHVMTTCKACGFLETKAIEDLQNKVAFCSKCKGSMREIIVNDSKLTPEYLDCKCYLCGELSLHSRRVGSWD